MNCELMLTYDTPAYMFNVYKNQPSRQTGSRNLMGSKTLTTIWGADMKLVTKYQICVINSCWEKCDEKCAYMFNVYKNQLSRQTGNRNLTGPKMLPTIWHIYMKLVTKYQISAIDSCWEKCNEKYLGRTDGRTEVKQYTPFPFGERGYNNLKNVAYLPCTYQIFFKNVCRNTGIYFFGPNMNYQSSR